MKKIERLIAFTLVSLMLISTAHADTLGTRFSGKTGSDCRAEYKYSMFESGISRQWGCDPQWISFLTFVFEMYEQEWDNGWGFDNPCDQVLPYKKTLNAGYLLYRASPTPVTHTSQMDGNFLRWAPNYASDRVERLMARCWKDDDKARHRVIASTNSFGVNDVKLYWSNHFGHIVGLPDGTVDVIPRTVVERASTLVHEARHGDGHGHVGDTGLDDRWKDWGAWYYHVMWHWWFARDASNTSTNRAMRQQAADAAIVFLDTRFINGAPAYHNQIWARP